MFLLLQSMICSLLTLWCATATHYFQLGLYRTWVFQYLAEYEYEVVNREKKTNASRKCARHALCNTIQSLGYTLNVINVKLRRQKENEHSTSKSVHDLHYTQRQAPHVSMEAMQSTSRPATVETFPDTHLTACDLHCSGVGLLQPGVRC